ncbi:RRQRL motif-containing zinc-binding protein [Nocardia nova]|uniref:RRQRL motif-containing zinc-binding protein n=1 Tax=Nocardia nova TaxID=37330 RepID=UPI001896340E|nr:RRQRL motif-containing zinc-binding protein [Nocardia nova]MBF6150280.1 hypothetical protein [Nocardia nova]
MIGPKDVRARDLPDPDGTKFGIPTYYWDTARTEGLETRRQLRAKGLRPRNSREIAAQVVRPRRGGREPLTAYLYRVEEAVPKRPATPERLEALARGRRTQQERAMERHGIDPQELDRPDITDEPVWDGWDGFDR